MSGLEPILLGVAANPATGALATGGLFGSAGAFSLGTTLGTLGTIGGVVGALSSSQAASDIARQNAALARQQAAQQERELRRKNRQILGRQRALFSKSGVQLEGTPLLVQQETAAEGELDALNIRHSGNLRSAQFLNQARAARLRGQNALLQGVIGIGRTILTAPQPRAPLPPSGLTPAVFRGPSPFPAAPSTILV